MADTINYANPLDNYRSYSYHFILSVSNSTNAFRELTQTKNGRPKALAAVEDISLGDKLDLEEGEAYLLADTRRFSQFMVTGLEMEHVYGTGDVVNPSVPIAAASMTLVDTTGLTFFNFLSDTLRNKLKTTRASAFFLLSIVFVGHKDDGTTEFISTCNIPYILLGMEFEFTSSGSIYNIQFMEIEGSTQRGSQLELLNSLGNVNSVSTQNGQRTIGQMIANLERALNIQSLAFYASYKNAATSSETGGKLLQYMITIPPDWENFKVTTGDVSERLEQMFLAKTQAEKDEEKTKDAVTIDDRYDEDDVYFTLSFSNATTITDAIMQILDSSLDFKKLASDEKIKGGEGKAFRTITNITSDATSYVVHFDVYPYTIPKPSDGSLKVNQKESNAESTITNMIQYDYVFTGRNSHILDLRIKYMPESAFALDTAMDIGASRFNTNATVKTTEKEFKKIAIGVIGEKTPDNMPLLKEQDVVIPTFRTKTQRDNAIGLEAADLSKEEQVAIYTADQEKSRNLAFMHFLSSLDLDVSIRGNPNILAKYADRGERGGIAPHGSVASNTFLTAVKPKTQEEAKSTYINELAPKLASYKSRYASEYYGARLANAGGGGDDALIGKPDVATNGLFVKLNIMAPNVDWTGQRVEGQSMFTNRFFYDGAYMVMFIKHTLVNGEFTQTMKLIPFDLDGTFIKSRDGDNDNSIQGQ